VGTIPRQATMSVVVDATPTAVREVVGDPTRTGEWSHECAAVEYLDGAITPRPGVRFRGRNRVGRSRWSRTCEILTLDPGHEISWRTIPSRLHDDSTVWTISVEPDGAGTRIEQRYEITRLSRLMERFIWWFVPVHRDRRPALAADLARIGAVAAGTPQREVHG
jgi:uncharacterized protein YndB with AHSA1/START domain